MIPQSNKQWQRALTSLKGRRIFPRMHPYGDFENGDEYIKIPVMIRSNSFDVIYDDTSLFMPDMWCTESVIGKNIAKYYESGQIELVKSICKNLMDRNSAESTFIHCCYMGYLELAKWLYDLGYINCCKNACYQACRNGQFETVEWLLGIDADIKSNIDTYLETSCMHNQIKIVKLLYYLTPFPYPSDKLFKIVCVNGYIDIAKWLYDLDVMNILNIANAFVLTCGNGHIELAKWLHSLDTEHKFNMMDAFVESCAGGHIEITKWLHSLESNVECYCTKAFMRACTGDYAETVKWLYSIGADVNIGGEWAFRIACRDGIFEMAMWLYDIGVNIHIGNEEALRLAYINGHYEIVAWLRNLGANATIAMCDENNKNAFALVCVENHFVMAEQLYELHATTNAIRKIAFNDVCESGELEIAKWLYSTIVDTGDVVDLRDAFKNSCENYRFETANWLLTIDSTIIVEFLKVGSYCMNNLDKFNYNNQKKSMIRSIVSGRQLDEYNEADDMILHLLAKHNRIADLERLKPPYVSISYDIVDDQIKNFTIKRIKTKSARYI